MAGMFERLSDRGRTVVSLAHEEVRRRLIPCVGTEALFLELVKQTDGVAAMVFRSFGVEVERVTCEIERLMVREPVIRDLEKVMAREEQPPPAGRVPMTPRAGRAIERAANEADNWNESHVGPEHLLLGLIDDVLGVPWQIVKNMGIEPQLFRREILRIIGRG